MLNCSDQQCYLKQIQDSGSLLAMAISESWAHLSAVILWNVIIMSAEVRSDYGVVYPAHVSSIGCQYIEKKWIFQQEFRRSEVFLTKYLCRILVKKFPDMIYNPGRLPYL